MNKLLKLAMALVIVIGVAFANSDFIPQVAAQISKTKEAKTALKLGYELLVVADPYGIKDPVLEAKAHILRGMGAYSGMIYGFESISYSKKVEGYVVVFYKFKKVETFN